MPETQPADVPNDGRARRRRRVVIAAALAVPAVIYVADLIITSGTVPRGVVAAGVPIGGMTLVGAEQRLRAEAAPRTTQPVTVTLDGTNSTIDPTAVGLTVDWARTVAQTGSQPLNPVTRIASYFSESEVGVVSVADDVELTAALQELATTVDQDPVEGSVRFVNDEPIPVDPQPGRQLDTTVAADVVKRDWATGTPVALPLVELPAATTAEDVADAVDDVARPAVSAPVSVLGDGGARGMIATEVIATALSFRAEDGALVPVIDVATITEALRPQLAASEVPGRDAALDFDSGTAVAVPSQDGRGIDYEATLSDLAEVLAESGDREISAVYADQPARFTTADLEALGSVGVIGEFQTGGFAGDSGMNIKRAAAQIDGIVVAPGATFSLNAATNPRTAAAGYVEAGVIENGRPARGFGGGVSQVATTLFNAAYFAGMVDVEHREHSYYIGRYPPGREATVSGEVIDLKFRNDNPTAVQIRTEWTPSSVTVRMLGHERFEVTSSQSARTNPTPPPTVTLPAGEACSSSSGSSGFTITDTRTLIEIGTGQSRTESHTVRYDPAPKVVCGG